MTKLEFKTKYSNYRRSNFEFWRNLRSANYPCGHDDMLCERHEYYTSQWLDENPIIKAVVEAESEGDYLADRMNNMYSSIKSAMQYRRGA